MENIKQELIELCDAQISLWQNLKNEVELISEEYDINVVLKWNSYFKDNVAAIYKLSDVKNHIKETENKLVKLNFTDEGKPIRTRTKILEDLESVLLELDAREESNNLVVEIFSKLSWIELCNKGIEFFQELIKA